MGKVLFGCVVVLFTANVDEAAALSLELAAAAKFKAATAFIAEGNVESGAGGGG